MFLKIVYEDGTPPLKKYGGKHEILHWIKYFSKINRIILKKYGKGGCLMLVGNKW